MQPRTEPTAIPLDNRDLELLASYENGPRIWDAASVFARVLVLEDRGFVAPAGESGQYALTEAGRARLAASDGSRTPIG
jgi:hypothetical protein